MALSLIPYQPLGFTPNVRPTSEDCGCDGLEYCFMAQPNDPICSQFKQTPCAPSIACDGDFLSVTQDLEQIVDPEFDNAGGNFIDNSNFGSSAFWVTAASWSIAAGVATKVGSATPEAISQTIMPTTANAMYKIVFTVSNWGGVGDIMAGFSLNVGASYTRTQPITGNGTFTRYLKSVDENTLFGGFSFNRFFLLGSALWTGDIDNVIVQRVAITWDFGNDNNDTNGAWQLNEITGFAETVKQGVPTAASKKQLQTLGVEPNSPALLEVAVEAGSSGTIAFDVGGTISVATVVAGATLISLSVTSGSFTYFKTVNNFGSGFSGTISEISLAQLQSDCWDFDPAQWTVGVSMLCKIAGAVDVLTNSVTLIAGELYQIEFIVVNMSDGQLDVSVDGAILANITTNNSYKLFVEPANNSQLSFTVNALFDGCISQVRIYRLKQDYIIELFDGDGNYVLTVSQDNVNYYEDWVTICFRMNVILANQLCEYNTTIFLELVVGTIDTISLCDGAGTIDIGGLLLDDLVIDSNPLKAALIAGGCNTDIIVTVTQQPATFFYDISVVNAYCCLDEIIGDDGSGSADYSTNFAPINCVPVNTDLPYGCYQLVVYDPCAAQFQEIIVDGIFENPLGVYWDETITDPNLTLNIIAQQLEAESLVASASNIQVRNYWQGTANDINNPIQVPVGAHNYIIEYDVVSNDDTTNIEMEVLMGMSIGAASYPVTVGHHIVYLNGADPEAISDPPPQWFGVKFSFNASVVGKIVVDNISVRLVEPFEATFVSRCIKYAESFPCSAFIEAKNNDNAFGFGFINTGFALRQRLPVKAINPTYPMEASDYLFSEGSKQKNFSQSEKTWLLGTGAVPDWVHDCLRLMRASETFRIGDPATNVFVDYFCPSGDYVPEWTKTGENLAPVKFEIQLKDTDVKFHRNV